MAKMRVFRIEGTEPDHSDVDQAFADLRALAARYATQKILHNAEPRNVAGVAEVHICFALNKPLRPQIVAEIDNIRSQNPSVKIEQARKYNV